MKLQRTFMSALGLFLSVILLSPVVARTENKPDGKNEISGEALLAQIVTALGGKENLAKVQSLYSRGYQKISQTDNDGLVTRYLQRPDRLRIENALHQTPSVRLLIGDKVWMAGGTGPFKEADQATRDGIIFLFNGFNLPFTLAEGQWVVNTAVNHDNRNDVLTVKNRSGQELTLTVNSTSHLITMVAGTFLRADTKENVVIAQEYQDYRLIDGVNLPFRIVSYYDKKPYAVLTLSEVKINQTMASSLFSPLSSVRLPPLPARAKKAGNDKAPQQLLPYPSAPKTNEGHHEH